MSGSVIAVAGREFGNKTGLDSAASSGGNGLRLPSAGGRFTGTPYLDFGLPVSSISEICIRSCCEQLGVSGAVYLGTIKMGSVVVYYLAESTVNRIVGIPLN